MGALFKKIKRETGCIGGGRLVYGKKSTNRKTGWIFLKKKGELKSAIRVVWKEKWTIFCVDIRSWTPSYLGRGRKGASSPKNRGRHCRYEEQTHLRGRGKNNDLRQLTNLCIDWKNLNRC